MGTCTCYVSVPEAQISLVPVTCVTAPSSSSPDFSKTVQLATNSFPGSLLGACWCSWVLLGISWVLLNVFWVLSSNHLLRQLLVARIKCSRSMWRCEDMTSCKPAVCVAPCSSFLTYCYSCSYSFPPCCGVFLYVVHVYCQI